MSGTVGGTTNNASGSNSGYLRHTNDASSPPPSGNVPSRIDDIPTAQQQLRDKEAACITLLSVTIPSWYAGRGSGRWNGIDSARKQCIVSRVQPDLRLGRMPSAEDNL